MTATERRYAGSSDNILSMDDESIYGETFTQMPFKEAISEGILSDYKIITLFISDKEVKEIIQKNAFVKPEGKEWDKETEARTLASLIALRKAMQQFPIHHAVTFHSSIKKAEAFEKSQAVFSKAFPKYKKVSSFHVSGAMPTSVRSKIVDEFAASPKGIITNAKCLTEGVDVPNIDCVLFADPRKSTVDIVQAVGRALRKKDGKQFGYVILPVFTESKSKEEIIESAEFKEVLSTLRALASNDERIIEFFKDKSKNAGSSSTPKEDLVQFDIDAEIIDSIKEKELMSSLQLRVWDKLAKLSWMSFEEAKLFALQNNIKNITEWYKITKSKIFPNDIPKRPDSAYRSSGWVNWGDFLGTGYISNTLRNYLSYQKAKEKIREFKIKSSTEYRRFIKLNSLTEEFPLFPNNTYKKSGWISWGDFLGSNKIADHLMVYRRFEDARKFVRSLKLKSSDEWQQYCKSGLKPADIPSTPRNTYKNKGWNGMSDFLGNEIIYRSYEEAREFVRKLNLSNSTEWRTYCKSGKKPENIPFALDQIYKDTGWKNWAEFLGPRNKYIEYSEAKKLVKKYNLKSQSDWRSFCKSGKKLDNIPFSVHNHYKDKGWVSWGDFLSTGRIADQDRKYLSFDEVKKFVHKMKFKNQKEWRLFAQSNKKPANIPYKVERTYKNEWIDWADFLGKE